MTQLWKNFTVAIDNAAGTLTALTAYVNQANIETAFDLLEDSVLSDEEKSYLPGMSGATVSFNGWINTTTEGIFGPLVGNRTSVSKTYEIGNGVKFYSGETYLDNIQMSGNVNTLPLWSCSATFDGAVTRSSVTLVS